MTNEQKPPRRNPTQPATPNLRGVITDPMVKAVQERNEQRAKKAAKALGNKHVLHRDAVARKPY